MIQINLPEIPVTLFGAVGQLTSNRTYYVAPTGSDSNDGLTDAKPFLTIQKAVDVVATTLAIAPGVVVTIQLADGTYALSSILVLRRLIGAGAVKIIGNPNTPGNVVVTTDIATHLVQVLAVSDSDYTVDGVRMESTVPNLIAFLADGGWLKIGNIDFGPGFFSHIHALDGGRIDVVADYAISGSASHHVVADRGAIVNINGRSVTVTGTPAFTAFATAQKAAVLQASSLTFTGAATGQRYLAALNGVIHTGAGANAFPGDAAGAANTGGQYA